MCNKIENFLWKRILFPRTSKVIEIVRMTVTTGHSSHSSFGYFEIRLNISYEEKKRQRERKKKERKKEKKKEREKEGEREGKREGEREGEREKSLSNIS
jgi:hypothetical protein